MQIALERNVPHVARNVWLSGFQIFVLFELVINEPTFPLSHTLLEGVWLSGIGRMAEVRNVPHLARKV